MPSASAKLEKQMSSETNDPVKQVVTIVEKKVRNLEKRKGKLDSYRQDSQNGKDLNEDQKKAIEKYDLVVELLDFAKELQKHFHTVIQESLKNQRKAVKRDQIERQQQELLRIKEIIMYQDILNNMGGEDVRQDFLNGCKGAVKLTEDDLNGLDELYKAIGPERDTDSFELIADSEENSGGIETVVTAAAEHLQSLLDAKNKEAFGTTYKSLRETLQKIHSCNYFSKSSSSIPEPESNTTVEDSSSDIKSSSEQDIVHYNQPESTVTAEEEDFVMVQKTANLVERPFFPSDSSSMYTEQPHPIQEVLSVQSNLNFLQESQIELESSRVESQPTSTLPATFTNVPYSVSAQSMSTAALVSSRSRRTSEETPNMVHPPPATSQSEFDPAGPIPTQTFTNQSFSTGMQPIIGAPQGYVAMPIIPSNMVVPQLSQRSTPAQSSLAAMTAGLTSIPPGHGTVGLSTAASVLSQQANIYSLCLKMNQLNAETSQPSHISPAQYNMSDMQENNIAKHPSSTFGNGGEPTTGITESRPRVPSNTYPRASTQMDYGNDRAYQSTNNSQAYMNRENFDSSSYSSNLKRGLTSRTGSRGVPAPRGTANSRGGRVGYRN